MEMNTRLQVEHPVTEAITGLDLVEWQFRAAAGDPLPLAQEEVRLVGHAVEARLYAEDPERGFLPSTGRLVALTLPHREGIRIDSGVEEGGEVTPYYDPMIAKMIAAAPTRTAALERLAAALDETVIAGPRSNVAFLAALARSAAFVEGRFDTGYIDRNLEALGATARPSDHAAAAAGVQYLIAREQARIAARGRQAAGEPGSPWDATDAFQLTGTRRLALPVTVDGDTLVADIAYGPAAVEVAIDGHAAASDAVTIDGGEAVYVLRKGRQTVARLKDFEAIDIEHLDSDGVVSAPMHGKVLAILVEPGAVVTKGQRLAVIEAMKMEHALTAPIDGTVVEVAATVGAQIAENAKVLVIAATVAADS
jgi:3-methylcrotonyl-CoA carboxylase alpha subunit